MTSSAEFGEAVINGARFRVPTTSAQPLTAWLRDRVGCASIHVGCEEGVCGACTVLVDGVSRRACLTVSAQIVGCTVTTAEGAAASAAGARLQQAFVACHAAQCGYCTPGFLMIGLELMAEYAGRELPDVLTVRQRLSAAVCRCTGYASIIAAMTAALALQAEAHE
jgi:aerobic-type carbon monoxide dehydrogenase small subunit (CoxS/CutS family)